MPPTDSTFTYPPSLSQWTHPSSTWLTENTPALITHNDTTPTRLDTRFPNPTTPSQISGLATGTAIFHPTSPIPKILLIQRAATDSMPLKWEIPGGAVDPEDESVLHGAAREVLEEAGLVVKRFGGFLYAAQTGRGDDGAKEGDVYGSMHVFPNRDGSRWFVRAGFWAEEVEGESDGKGEVVVRLDPKEHADFVWATEEEVKEERVGGKRVPITREPMKGLILEAFRARRESGESG